MWVRLNFSGVPRLVAADQIIEVGPASGSSGNFVFSVKANGVAGVTTYSSITVYGTAPDAQQAADDLAQALASPQIVET